MPGEDIPSSLYDWKENFCKECRRYVEIDEFKFDREKNKITGTCKVCGKIIYDYEFTEENYQKTLVL